MSRQDPVARSRVEIVENGAQFASAGGEPVVREPIPQAFDLRRVGELAVGDGGQFVDASERGRIGDEQRRIISLPRRRKVDDEFAPDRQLGRALVELRDGDGVVEDVAEPADRGRGKGLEGHHFETDVVPFPGPQDEPVGRETDGTGILVDRFVNQVEALVRFPPDVQDFHVVCP